MGFQGFSYLFSIRLVPGFFVVGPSRADSPPQPVGGWSVAPPLSPVFPLSDVCKSPILITKFLLPYFLLCEVPCLLSLLSLLPLWHAEKSSPPLQCGLFFFHLFSFLSLTTPICFCLPGTGTVLSRVSPCSHIRVFLLVGGRGVSRAFFLPPHPRFLRFFIPRRIDPPSPFLQPAWCRPSHHVFLFSHLLPLFHVF